MGIYAWGGTQFSGPAWMESGHRTRNLSIEEMIGLFSLEQIGKSGARFDFDKAKWF